MDRTTLILPISRDDFLDDFLSSIELLKCEPGKISVLAIVDGDVNLYLKVRNRFNSLKFDDKLVVQYKSKQSKLKFDTLSRRLRISEIHNFAKEHIGKTEYIMVIEDDTIVPRDAYEKLHNHYLNVDMHAGFVQGIEVGRWGIRYLGAWVADDIYDTKEIKSTPLREGVKPVDAGGFYCFMTKTEYYINHEFKPFDNNGLGPDVDYGLEMRRQGLNNYTDYSIKCIHKTDKDDVIINNNINIVTMVKNETGRWRQSHV